MIAPALQKKVLLLLVLLWAAIGGAMLLWGSTEKKVAPVSAARKNPPARPAASKARGELDLALWERKQEPLQAGTHNPFHPLAGYFEPPPPPPGAKLKAALPPPPDPFIEELKTFKYFGYAEDQNKKVAFLSKGNSSYTVKEKDIIENKFLVKKITEDYVVLGEPQGSKELTIAQSGSGETGPGAATSPRPGSPAPMLISPSPRPPSPPIFYTPPPPRSPTTPIPPPTPQERRGLRDRPAPMPPPIQIPKEGG